MVEELSEWVPERVSWSAEGPVVEWIYTGGRRFTEPFFEDTVHRIVCETVGAAVRRRTTMAEAEAWVRRWPGIEPAGFVFHMSRCGSTLVSRMLAAVERNRVMSEPPALDDVLRLQFRCPEVDPEQLAVWLRAVVSALGQPATEAERHLFVKWDCWHTHQLPLIRRAFPRTPWIFLYRDPLEVLVSQMRNPGMWTVPGTLEPELTGRADPREGREEYCAQMLGAICEAALREQATLVNYTELPESVWARLATYFGMELTEAEREMMRSAAQADAKSPNFAYVADGEAKRRGASGRAVEATERWAGEAYRELERLRQVGRGLPG
jgi:hypothetical protein